MEIPTVRRSEWKGHVTEPKGGRIRYVPLTARLAAALREHRHLRSKRFYRRVERNARILEYERHAALEARKEPSRL